MTEGSAIRLTSQHAGRFMQTRDGERVGPMEFDPHSFGYDNDKHWRGSLGSIRVYYWVDGRVIAEELGPNDIVGDWIN